MSSYPPPADAVTSFSILRVGDAPPEAATDMIATEEPLEILLGHTRRGIEVRKTIAVTMRTPGHDLELAAGFLFAEGLVHARRDITDIANPADRPRAILVTLRPDVAVDLRSLERTTYTTSSCGVCGKTSLDAIRGTGRHPMTTGEPVIDPQAIHRLPLALRSTQAGFGQTGGLHAAALFAHDGRVIEIREDVGRHNALDKLIGAQLLAGRIPLSDQLLFVSSRASFELMQKALTAGCPVLAAVGAPTSLAIELAREAGATLLGFVRDRRFNVYAGATRLRQLGLAHSTP